MHPVTRNEFLLAEHRETAAAARQDPREAGTGEGADRGVGGKVARDPEDPVGAECPGAPQERRRRRPRLGDAPSRRHRRRPAQHRRHPVPSQRGPHAHRHRGRDDHAGASNDALYFSGNSE